MRRNLIWTAAIAGAWVPSVAVAGGTLLVETDNAGLPVFIDGDDVGMDTPATIQAMPSGAHIVRVGGDCEGGETRAYVRDGRLTKIKVPTQKSSVPLTVVAVPSSAVISIDGEEVAIGTHQVDCGKHVVRGELDGYLPKDVPINLTDTRPFDVQVNLVAAIFGTLTVDVNMEDSFVLLDGELIGEGGVWERRVLAGTHKLRVEAEGFVAEEQELNIEKDGDVRLNVKLRKDRNAVVVAGGRDSGARASRSRPTKSPAERRSGSAKGKEPVAKQDKRADSIEKEDTLFVADEPKKPAKSKAPKEDKTEKVVASKPPRPPRDPIDKTAVAGWSMVGVGTGVGILAVRQLSQMVEYGQQYNGKVDRFNGSPVGAGPTRADVTSYREDVLLPQRNKAVVTSLAAAALLGGGVTVVVRF